MLKNPSETPSGSEFVPNHEDISNLLNEKEIFLEKKLHSSSTVELEPRKVEFSTAYDPKKDAGIYGRTVVETRINPHGIPNYREHALSRVTPEIRDIATQEGISNDQKVAQIQEFLSQRYLRGKETVDKYLAAVQEAYEVAGPRVITLLQKMYGASFTHEKVTIYLTTGLVCPYDPDKGYFFVSAGREFSNDFRNEVDTGVHEMNHFMWTNSKYPEQLKDTLTPIEIDLLKESLTYFTDEEDPSTRPNEKPLKQLYASKEWETLDEVVAAAAKLIISERK